MWDEGDGIPSQNNCELVHSTTRIDRLAQVSADYVGMSVQLLPVLINEVLLEHSQL